MADAYPDHPAFTAAVFRKGEDGSMRRPQRCTCGDGSLVERYVMAPAVRAYRFEVSDYFFRLTTEAVRLFSNSIGKHSCLGDVVDHRSSRMRDIAESYDIEDLQEHLRLIPAQGKVDLSLKVLETSAGAIDAAIPEIERVLGSSVQFSEAVSLMLFDLVVERNATELITKLGLTSSEAREYRPRLKRRVTNVVSIR